MPTKFFKRRNPTKKFVRRSRRRAPVASLAKRVRKLEIMDRPEVKYQEVAVNNATLGAIDGASGDGYYVYPILAIGQGDNVNQRTGDKIRFKSFYIKGTFKPQGNVVDGYAIDMWVIRWNQFTNGASVPIGGTSGSPTVSFLNLDGAYGKVTSQSTRVMTAMGGWNVLYKKRFYIARPAVAGQQNYTPFEGGFKVKMRPNINNGIVNFSGIASSDLQQGAYYVLFTISNGNRNVTTGTAPNTGVNIYFDNFNYFTDV